MITLFIPLQSCDFDECDGINYLLPWPDFYFRLIDKTTGEDLFTNGTYDRSQVEFTDENNDKLSFFFTGLEGTIALWSLGQGDGEVNVTLRILDQTICQIHAHVETRSKECYTYQHYDELEVTSEFDVELVNGEYVISIE